MDRRKYYVPPPDYSDPDSNSDTDCDLSPAFSDSTASSMDSDAITDLSPSAITVKELIRRYNWNQGDKPKMHRRLPVVVMNNKKQTEERNQQLREEEGRKGRQLDTEKKRHKVELKLEAKPKPDKLPSEAPAVPSATPVHIFPIVVLNTKKQIQEKYDQQCKELEESQSSPVSDEKVDTCDKPVVEQAVLKVEPKAVKKVDSSVSQSSVPPPPPPLPPFLPPSLPASGVKTVHLELELSRRMITMNLESDKEHFDSSKSSDDGIEIEDRKSSLSSDSEPEIKSPSPSDLCPYQKKHKNILAGLNAELQKVIEKRQLQLERMKQIID
ncbi:hypothetical protein HDE_11857 [Halotydeus destructor]|nr:hypothetical protein HDE_11857 [Halotydeus destructor]